MNEIQMIQKIFKETTWNMKEIVSPGINIQERFYYSLFKFKTIPFKRKTRKYILLFKFLCEILR